MQLQTNIEITKCSPNVDAHIFQQIFIHNIFLNKCQYCIIENVWTLLLLGQTTFELMLCQMHPWDILNMNVTATFNRIKGRDASS